MMMIQSFMEAIDREDFLQSIEDPELEYKFDYEIYVRKTKNDEFCIPELQEDVEKILSLLNPATEQSFLRLVRKISDCIIETNRRIYPDKMIWKKENRLAGIDFAYALALYHPVYCSHFGDYLLSTDPHQELLQYACINSLINKHGINKHTLYLLGSFSLHDAGRDNLQKLLRSELGTEIKANKQKLLERMGELNSITKKKYNQNYEEIVQALQ